MLLSEKQSFVSIKTLSVLKQPLLLENLTPRDFFSLPEGTNYNTRSNLFDAPLLKRRETAILLKTRVGYNFLPNASFMLKLLD